MTSIDELIKISIALTAALEAAVSLSDIPKALEISAKQEKVLAELVQQEMTEEFKLQTAALAEKWLLEHEALMEKVKLQKNLIEIELRKQVKSNHAVSLYHGNHR
jgi:hypothetical protein